jgi:hypothetical protein
LGSTGLEQAFLEFVGFPLGLLLSCEVVADGIVR